MSCSNFLAGLVPCACPEVDEKLMELEEEEAGKFHVLSDFDEGKRCCRRKLERHNNRRRKPVDSKGAKEKDFQGDIPIEDLTGDGEAGKDFPQTVQKESFVESEGGQVSPQGTATDTRDNSDGFASLADSGETQMDGGKYKSKQAQASSYYDNKSAYSSMELRDIATTEAVKGKHFFLESDIKGPHFKLDNTGKAILSVLRHLSRISETRIGHNCVIIVLKPQRLTRHCIWLVISYFPALRKFMHWTSRSI